MQRSDPVNMGKYVPDHPPEGSPSKAAHASDKGTNAQDHESKTSDRGEAFELGLARTGQRCHRLVAYNAEFLMATLPTTTRGTAKVIPNRGVKINHILYWCEAFRYPDCRDKQVAVRFDPFDIGTAFAFVHNEWHACHSEHYLTLRGHSERELMLATEEIRRLHQDHSRGTLSLDGASRIS